MGKFLAPRITVADLATLTPDESEVLYVEDATPPYYCGGDGATLGGIPLFTVPGGGGGGITLYSLETDANFSLVDATAHEIPNNEFTANRTVNVSGLTTEAEIYNGTQSYTLTFTGGTVYRAGGAVTETEVMSGATTHLRKVGTKIFIIN
jgi:hypothetical protein